MAAISLVGTKGKILPWKKMKQHIGDTTAASFAAD